MKKITVCLFDISIWLMFLLRSRKTSQTVFNHYRTNCVLLLLLMIVFSFNVSEKCEPERCEILNGITQTHATFLLLFRFHFSSVSRNQLLDELLPNTHNTFPIEFAMVISSMEDCKP